MERVRVRGVTFAVTIDPLFLPFSQREKGR